MMYSFLQSGDTAITVKFKDEISKEVNQKVSSFSNSLNSAEIKGVIELIPSFSAVTVIYNPCIISSFKLKFRLKKILNSLKAVSDVKPTLYKIPVCYEEEFAPDIKNVVNHTGLAKEDIISIHTGTDYLIYMLGFLPGFAYLGEMDKRLTTPRLDTPRLEIAKGSVGIGGEQTGIYPVSSPGGWQLIGKTPVSIYDKDREKPVLYRAGDYIRFVSITKEEYFLIEQKCLNGTFEVETEEICL